MIYGLVIGSVALVTALAYWQNRLGYVGLGVIGGVVFVTLASAIVLPERAWARLVGADLLASDLGNLHSEGAQLRHELPWLPDPVPAEFDNWAARTDEWDDRVQERLAGSPWLGTFLSPVVGFRTATGGYETASRYRNVLDDRLERLGQIIAAVGGRR